jgi:hypothetical protein
MRLAAMNMLLHGIGGESGADMPLNNGLPANLPAPEIIAQEITDDPEAALEQFATISEVLENVNVR